MTGPVTGPAADTAQETAVRAVVDAVVKAKEILDGFVDVVNRALATWPALQTILVEPLARLSAKVGEALSILGKLLTERGNASAIRAVAADWNTLVGGATSEQAGLVDRGQLESQAQWAGAAADKYLTVVFNQRGALTAIKAMTDGLQNTLNEIADEIRAYWIYLAAETAAWLALMITCMITAALGGLPAAIVASVAYVGAVLKQSVDFDHALTRLRQKLEQQLATNDAFAGDSWPPVQSNYLADASVRDGDPSDWTPNT